MFKKLRQKLFTTEDTEDTEALLKKLWLSEWMGVSFIQL
jgi:hypothetical protein